MKTYTAAELNGIIRLHVLWLRGYAVGVRADLRGADLRGADLRGADLSDAHLSGADLRGAHLSDAHLSDADLRGAHLSGADLRGADLRGADLSDADLSDADLRGAHLSDAHLRGATGNGHEVMSAAVRHWPLTWTTDADGLVTLQIGCQRHPLEMWERSDPRWIAALDPHATEWWSTMREPVLALVKASPATRHAGVEQ